MAERASQMGREFEPARVSGDDAEAVMDEAIRLERAAGSIRVRAAARAAAAHAWKQSGHRSAEDWFADKSGTSKAKAKKKLKLGEQLDRHEKLRDRYGSGGVSDDQAEVIGGAADENPDAEDDLLDAAEDESLHGLKKKAAQAKAEVSDEEERQAKIHDQRYGSGGPDEEGAYRLGGRFAAMPGGIFDTHWQRFRDKVAADAKKKGLKLTAGQIAADALVLMAQTAAEADAGGSLAGLGLPDVTMHILIDDTACERGYVVKGETCEIDGIGPITVQQAMDLTQHGAFVTASSITRDDHGRIDVHRVAHLGTTNPAELTTEKLHDYLAEHGTDVQTIDLPGRAHIPAVLDTAVRIRDRVCRHPGCHHRWRLQRDHKTAVGLGGRTTYHQLQRLCWPHHESKTRDDIRNIRAKKQAERAGPAP